MSLNSNLRTVSKGKGTTISSTCKASQHFHAVLNILPVRTTCSVKINPTRVIFNYVLVDFKKFKILVFFKTWQKIGVLQTYPLKKNHVLEIRADPRISMETPF